MGKSGHKTIIDKVELYNLFVEELWSTKKLAGHFDCTTVTINARLKEWGISWDERKKNDPEENRFTYEKMFLLYVKEQKSLVEISEIFNSTPTVIVRRLQKLGITNEQKREEHHNSYNITPIQHDVIIGSMLGDGALNMHSESTNLMVFHQESQREYCQSKFEVLRSLCVIDELKFSYRLGEKDCYNRQNQYYFYTRFLKKLNTYNEYSIIDTLNNLNENSLAIWYLDDGSLEIKNYKKGNGHASIACRRFKVEEIEQAIKILKEKFNICAKIKWRQKSEGVYSGLKFDIADTDKLIHIIRNSEIGKLMESTMPYKLLMEH